MTEIGCTECGHNLSSHELITEPLDPQVYDVGSCSIDGCYCGRNPLTGATITTCGWCTTGAPVVWARTVNGKRMMIEPEPNPNGNCSISYERGVPVVTVHKSPPGMFDDWTPFMPHIATCDQKLRNQQLPKGNHT